VVAREIEVLTRASSTQQAARTRCVAMCCRALQCVAVRCSTQQAACASCTQKAARVHWTQQARASAGLHRCV